MGQGKNISVPLIVKTKATQKNEFGSLDNSLNDNNPFLLYRLYT